MAASASPQALGGRRIDRVMVLKCPERYLTDIARRIVFSLEEVARDPDVEAIALLLPGRAAVKRTDYRAARDWARLEDARAACATLRDSVKPVVAVWDGLAQGHWAELALQASARVIVAEGGLALPDINFGLLPALGGGLPLMQLIDAKLAGDLAARGRAIRADEALSAGLIARCLPTGSQMDTLAAAVMAVAASMPQSTPKQSGDAGWTALSEFSLGDNVPVERLIETLEAATLLPIAQAVAMAEEAYLDMATLPECQANVHLAAARQQLTRLPKALPRGDRIDTLAIVGAQEAGTELATAALVAGVGVGLHDANPQRLARATQAISRMLAGHERRSGAGRERWGALTVLDAPQSLSDHDVVIDAAGLGADGFKRGLAAVVEHLKPGAMVVSANPWQDLPALRRALPAAGAVALCTFPKPANGTLVAEISWSTAHDTVSEARLVDLLDRMGKAPVVVSAGPGLAANALLDALVFAAYQLVIEGAAPSEVDRELTGWGMERGPFELLDLIGLWRYAQPRVEEPELLTAMREAGFNGRSKRVGFYTYDRAKGIQPHDISTILAPLRARHGDPVRKLDGWRMRRLTHLALVNAGARLLRERRVGDSASIDILATESLNLPAQEGGPLFMAERAGLVAVRHDLSALSKKDARWTPDTLIDLAIQHGQSFEAAISALSS
ncbi:MAG: 3-hydroxyacyl-CoA dehydrogenase family protein [Pseudomonadota bacterium]